jgi:hypothetical protein
MHYGSLMTTTDYTTDVKMINGGFSLIPTPKLAVTVSGNYSINDAEFDPVVMPEVSTEVEDNLHTEGYDYSMIHGYSDMSYKHLSGSFKINYMISPKISWNADITYLNFTDDTGYVYGDETGSLLIVRTGLEYSF